MAHVPARRARAPDRLARRRRAPAPRPAGDPRDPSLESWFASTPTPQVDARPEPSEEIARSEAPTGASSSATSRGRSGASSRAAPSSRASSRAAPPSWTGSRAGRSWWPSRTAPSRRPRRRAWRSRVWPARTARRSCAFAAPTAGRRSTIWPRRSWSRARCARGRGNEGIGKWRNQHAERWRQPSASGTLPQTVPRTPHVPPLSDRRRISRPRPRRHRRGDAGRRAGDAGRPQRAPRAAMARVRARRARQGRARPGRGPRRHPFLAHDGQPRGAHAPQRGLREGPRRLARDDGRRGHRRGHRARHAPAPRPRRPRRRPEVRVRPAAARPRRPRRHRPLVGARDGDARGVLLHRAPDAARAGHRGGQPRRPPGRRSGWTTRPTGSASATRS